MTRTWSSFAPALLALFWVAVPAAASEPQHVFPRAAVASDSALASRIGAEVLAAGGNAADAAVAVGLALGVAQPFASGLGGGGFLLYRDAATGEVLALDFRETAPRASSDTMFLAEDGSIDRELYLFSGRSVATPGELRGWWALHERFGRMAWADVIAPVTRLASEGFEAPELLLQRLAFVEERGRSLDRLGALYDAPQWPPQAGDWLRMPALAATLGQIAAEGWGPFYEGEMADAIVRRVRAERGVLDADDLVAYRAVWREPFVTEFAGHVVYGMGPPSSSGLVIAQVLRYLEHFPLPLLQWNEAATTHILAHGLAHAFADRARYLGDEDFVVVDRDALLSAARIEHMVQTWLPRRAPESRVYGPAIAPPDNGGTAHFSIVDEAGNAVAVTTTVNTTFGSFVVVDELGIVLNNEMADFTPTANSANVFGLYGAEANRVEPNKRPLSSMAPLIVTREGQLVGSLGGSGGPRIISGSLMVLVQLLLYRATAADAIAAPRIHHQWQPNVLYVEETLPESVSQRLEAYGWTVQRQPFGNAVQAVWRHPQGWEAASDPRKLGSPAGI